MRIPWLWLSLAACSTHQQARWGTRGESTCPDDRGCELAIGSAEQYQAPTEGWTPPPEPGLGVAPPAKTPDCTAVGTAVAALEVGNYADEATRGPVVRKHAARCVDLRLNADERTCVYAARDQAAMAYCAPRLLPAVEVHLFDPSACGPLIDRMRERLRLSNDKNTQLRLAAVADSCRQDRWTADYAQCAERAAILVDPGYCRFAAPSTLQVKIEDRFAKLPGR